MMTQQLGFSVLTAPIAAIDRRALSQAWYSALHLARRSHEGDRSIAVCTVRSQAHEKTPVSFERTSPNVRAPLSTRVHREAERIERDPQPLERRAIRSSLARKIEHAFLRPNVTAKRATFTIDGTAARVQVSMQHTRSGLRLIAVCPSHTRKSVARALEQARYALAARGISVDARIVE